MCDKSVFFVQLSIIYRIKPYTANSIDVLEILITFISESNFLETSQKHNERRRQQEGRFGDGRHGSRRQCHPIRGRARETRRRAFHFPFVQGRRFDVSASNITFLR